MLPTAGSSSATQQPGNRRANLPVREHTCANGCVTSEFEIERGRDERAIARARAAWFARSIARSDTGTAQHLQLPARVPLPIPATVLWSTACCLYLCRTFAPCLLLRSYGYGSDQVRLAARMAAWFPISRVGPIGSSRTRRRGDLIGPGFGFGSGSGYQQSPIPDVTQQTPEAGRSQWIAQAAAAAAAAAAAVVDVVSL